MALDLLGAIPGVRDIAQGVRKNGVLGAVTSLPSAVGDIVDTANPVHFVQDAVSGITGRDLSTGSNLTSGQRLASLVGVGALGLGVLGGVEARQRFRALQAAGEDELGAIRLPSFPEIRTDGPYVKPKYPSSYRRYNPRSAFILDASSSFEDLADIIGHGRDPARAGFLQGYGQRLTSEVPHLQTSDPQFAASWALSRFDALAETGRFNTPASRPMADAYELLKSNPRSLFDDTGRLNDTGQRLFNFMLGIEKTLPKELEAYDLSLPPQLAWAGVDADPQGQPRLGIVWRHEALPRQPMGVEDQLHLFRHFDYEAAMPEMTSNVLRAVDVHATPNEIRSGLKWYFDAHDLAQELANKSNLSIEQAAGIVSALSAGTEWNYNVALARAFVASNGETTTVTVPNQYTGKPQVVTQTADNINRARRLLAGESVDSVFGKSEKTKNFLAAIANPNEHGNVVIDRHSFDVAMGYTTGIAGVPVFDQNPAGRRAYNAIKEAHENAARIKGLLDHQVQAIGWETYKALKGTHASGGVGAGNAFETSSNIRAIVEGRGDPNVAELARRTADDGRPIPFELPTPKTVKNKLGVNPQRGQQLPRLVEVIEPDGKSTVAGLDTPEVRAAVRVLRPLRPEVEDLGNGMLRYVPTTGLRVDDVHALGLVDQFSDGLLPPGTAEVHTLQDHPTMVPGNHVTVLLPHDNVRMPTDLQTHLKDAGLPYQVESLGGVTRYEPERTARKLGPEDLAGLRPKDFRQRLDDEQWVAISGMHAPGKPKSWEENLASHEQLGEQLRAAGYNPIEQVGSYGEPEKSWLVFGMPVSEGMKFGKRFQQESIATPLGIVYTTGENVGKYNPVTEKGIALNNKLSDFYSETPLGSKSQRWALDIDWDTLNELPDPDFQVKALPQGRNALVVHLGDTPRPDDIQAVWDEIGKWADGTGTKISRTAQLHGNVGPKGTTQVNEQHFADRNGVGLVVRSKDPLTRHGAPVWVDSKEAETYRPLSVPQRPAVQEATRRDADFVWNGRVRIVARNLEDEQPTLKVVGGRLKADSLAMLLPSDDAPVVAIGEDAPTILRKRTRNIQGDLVFVQRRKGALTIQAQNTVIADRAAGVLAELGITGRDIHVRTA